MLRTTNPETKRLIPGHLNPQLHCSANPKYWNIITGLCMPYIKLRAIRIRRSVTCCLRCQVTAKSSRTRIKGNTHNRSFEESAVTTLWALMWNICKSDYYGSFISLLTGRCISVKSTLLWQALQNSRLWRMNSQTLQIQIWIVQHSGKKGRLADLQNTVQFALSFVLHLRHFLYSQD